MDLLSPSAKRHLDAFLHPDTRELTSEAKTQAGFGGRFARMTAALGQVLEDYSLGGCYSTANDVVNFGILV